MEGRHALILTSHIIIFNDFRIDACMVKWNYQLLLGLFHPLSAHDALKHHFTFLKTDLIFLQQRVLERKSP